MASLVDEVRQVAKGWRWTQRPLTPRSAEAWVGPPEPRVFPTAWARTAAARAVREAMLRYGFRPIVWTETEPRVEGLDHLDTVKPPVDRVTVCFRLYVGSSMVNFAEFVPVNV